jgi:hypothetical protein
MAGALKKPWITTARAAAPVVVDARVAVVVPVVDAPVAVDTTAVVAAAIAGAKPNPIKHNSLRDSGGCFFFSIQLNPCSGEGEAAGIIHRWL